MSRRRKNIVEKVEKIKREKNGIYEEEKKPNFSQKIKIIIFYVAIVIFIIVLLYLVYYFCSKKQDRNVIKEIQDYTPIVNTEINERSEIILKVESLKKENDDIRGWIKIDDTVIDYPILQSQDNEYYLKHDYKKQYNKYGSIYLKTGCDINDKNSNLIIYGHNMKDTEMFNSLLKYESEDFYNTHKTIKVTTENEEREYEIIVAFKSRVFYEMEKNVFRYYNYLNFENAEKYNEFLLNAKTQQLYDTKVSAEYGEQLMTLITCEYSQENGRMVVVAKRVK